MPHVLIKYAHVLICISAGEDSWHFSAFHIKSNYIVLGGGGGGGGGYIPYKEIWQDI